MRRRLAYICATLVFCTGSAVCLAESAQYSIGGCIVAALLLTFVQQGLWRIGRLRTFLTFSLTFLPTLLFELGMLLQCKPLFPAGVLVIVVYLFVPRKWLPKPRTSTSFWVGTLIYMLEISLFAGILASV